VLHVQASLPFICPPPKKKVAELLSSKWKQIVVVTAQQFQVCLGPTAGKSQFAIYLQHLQPFF
jgi:hypothetical protein